MPSASVAAIITRTTDGASQILLTRRSNALRDFPGAWVLPGGRVDQYETRERAIIREVQEETGLTFYPTLFGVYDEIFEERGIHAVVTVYVGTCDGEMRADEHEVSEIAWFSLDAALNAERELGFEHRKILLDFANRRNA
jgi:ADP-ribose pyrophosphatase YjhB (NUDIX family)